MKPSFSTRQTGFIIISAFINTKPKCDLVTFPLKTECWQFTLL